MSILRDIKKPLNLLFSKRLGEVVPLGGISNKVILVTGASKGVGKSIAEYLYFEGCSLVLVSRDLEVLKREFPETKYKNVLLLEGDVRKVDVSKRVIKEAVTKFGRIDVLINNAGIFLEKPLEATTNEELDAIIDTNIKSVAQLSIAVLPHMKPNKSGTIINIGSKISHNTNIGPNKVLYAATKYAVEGFSFALNKELKEFGIRVICIMPGTINTFVSVKAGDYLSPSRVAQLVGMVLKFDDLDFEGIVFKSIQQNI